MKPREEVIFPVYTSIENGTRYAVGEVVGLKTEIRGVFRKRQVNVYAVQHDNNIYWRDEEELEKYL